MALTLQQFVISRASSIKVGFSTNSSSSHSIVLLPEGEVDILKALASLGGSFQETEPGIYGWETFVLTTKEEKMDYMWTDLYGQLGRMVHLTGPYSLRYDPPNTYPVGRAQLVEKTPSAALAAIEKLNWGWASYILGASPSFSPDVGPYIDHDSCFSFPLDSDGVPHQGFARWLTTQVCREGVVIFGGNDNDGPNELVEAYTTDHKYSGYYPLNDEYASPSSVKDQGEYWLLFQKDSGLTLRVPKVEGQLITRAPSPELIDVKITDHCPVGCEYCYQGSTPDKAHPSLPWGFLELLKTLEPVELAIGGGEAVLHPDFGSLLGNSYVVNLTTRLPQKIKPEHWKRLGGVGISIDRADEIPKHLKNVPEKYVYKVCFHVVLGTIPLDEVFEILKTAREEHTRCLLLDFKTDGRGASFTPHPYDDLITRLDSYLRAAGSWCAQYIGVDTPLAARFDKELQALGIHPSLYHTREGAFSMYIDATNGTFSKASYGDHQKFSLRCDNYGRYDAAHVLGTFRNWNAPEAPAHN